MARPFWAQYKAVRNELMQYPLVKFWREKGRFIVGAATAAVDIGISDNHRVSAALANAGLLSAAWLMRKQTGALPFVVPGLVYGLIRGTGYTFFGRNKAVNPIKAHDAGRWGREQTFASGDFEPGSSLKSMFGVLRNPIKSLGNWRFARRLTKGAELYEDIAIQALKSGGITEEFSVMSKVAPLGDVGGIEVSAFNKAGEELLSATRYFEKSTVDLTLMDVAKSLQGKGIGWYFQSAEVGILGRMGYKPGALVSSPVVSPITARFHGLLYNDVHFTQAGGKWGNRLEELMHKVMAKQIKIEEFPGAEIVGRLPSNKSINPIKGHSGGRWGREQTFAGGDFKPDASWIGDVIKRLFDRSVVINAAYGIRGPRAWTKLARMSGVSAGERMAAENMGWISYEARQAHLQQLVSALPADVEAIQRRLTQLGIVEKKIVSTTGSVVYAPGGTMVSPSNAPLEAFLRQAHKEGLAQMTAENQRLLGPSSSIGADIKIPTFNENTAIRTARRNRAIEAAQSVPFTVKQKNSDGTTRRIRRI